MNDEPPTPEQHARFYLGVVDDLAVAVRLMSAMHAKDPHAVHAITCEIIESRREMDVAFALALQALNWARQLLGGDDDAMQRQLDALAMHNLDAAQVLGKAWRDQQNPPK
jgi:hypothetical protein